MVTKAITASDLVNLENKIKLDVKKENIEERHNLDNKLRSYFFKVDDPDKKSAVTDNILLNMTNSIERLENLVTGWFEEMKKEMKSIRTEFVTKEENLQNKKRLDAHDAIISRIAWGIVGWFISIVAWLVWISKYM